MKTSSPSAARIVGILNINYGTFTDHIPYQDGEQLLADFKDNLLSMGPGMVSVTTDMKSDSHLAYEVHKLLVGEFGISPAPEKLWRISIERDANFLRKLECIFRYESADPHPDSLTIALEECECVAGVRPNFEKMSDEGLSALVNAIYRVLPEEYQLPTKGTKL